jgi:two-component system sensor histidine kinase TctE
VTVEVTRRGARVVLAVVDNGPGIDEAEHTRLTGRWQQGVDGLRLGGGAGLGLYIVARYAGLLGADLTIGGGTDGRGARVALALPERPADSPVNAP